MRSFFFGVVLLVVLLVVWPLVGWAQHYFNERYSSAGQQSYVTNVIANDSGYVAFGQAMNTSTWSSQALMVRLLHPDGTTRRTRYFGRPGVYYYVPFGGGGLMPQPGGGYLLAVTVADQQGRALPPMLWCFSEAGDTLWTHTYTGQPPYTVFYGGCRALNQDVVLVGSQPGTADTVTSFFVMRTDPLGNPRWQHRYAFERRNSAQFVEPTPDGGFLVGGGSVSRPQSLQGRLLKIDSLGRLEWHYTVATPPVDCGGTAVGVAASDGNYWMASSIGLRSINGYHLQRNIVAKLSPQGQLLWQKVIGPEGYTGPITLHELFDGSLVVTGQQSDSTGATPLGNGFPDGFAYRVCANGDSVWYRSYKKLTGGGSHNYLREFRPTPDGGFVGGGYLFTYPPDTGSNDAWVFRVDANGYLQAGGAPPTVRCVPVGVGELTMNNEPLAIWPNPSADGRFTLEALPGAALILTDALGREVWRTTHRTRLTSHLLPHPGLYLLRVQAANGQMLTCKLVRE